MRSLDHHNTKIVAVIPARGGSQGIEKKNIYPLCGKPLLAYSIEAALSAKMIERVVVSTDDSEIADIALKFGAEVPFLRPKGLAGSRASVGDTVSHLLDYLVHEGWSPFAFTTLYPTHPFRKPSLIDYLLGMLFKGYDRVVTVKSTLVTPYTFFTESDGKMTPIVEDITRGGPYPLKYHRPYGFLEAVVIRLRNLPKYLYEITDPAGLLDIDHHEDIHYAELILQNALFNPETEPSLQ